MEDLIGLVCFLSIVGVMLSLGIVAGGITERNHLQRLARQEAANRDVLVTQLRTFPDCAAGKPPTLLVSEVVLGTDYFKNFLASWIKLFGGELRSYTIVVERARREALVRLVEQARGQGYNALCNVRFESADMGGANSGRRMALGAVLATATAYNVPVHAG